MMTTPRTAGSPGHAPGFRLTPLKLAAFIGAIALLKTAVMWVFLPYAARHGIVPGTVATAYDLYFHIAQNVLDGHGFRVTPDTAETMMRGPGYVYFLAAVFGLFGVSLTVAQIANLVLSVGTVLLTILLAQRVTSNSPMSVIAGLIVAFHPAILFMESRVNVEILFIFLLTAFALLLHRALRNGNPGSFFLAGLMLGLVTLTRSSPAFIVPLLFVYLVARGDSAGRFGPAAIRTAALGIGTVLVLSPWMLRNYNLSDTPTFSENLIGIAAYESQYVTRAGIDQRGYMARIMEARKEQSRIAASKGVEFTMFDKDHFWDIFPSIEQEKLYNHVLLQEVIRDYTADPALFIRHCAANLVRFWFQGATPKVTMLGLFANVPLLVMAVAGIMVASRRGIVIAPFLLIIATLYAVHTPLLSHARYSTPLVPLLAVLAAIALSSMSGNKSRATA